MKKRGERTLLNNSNYAYLVKLRELSPSFQYDYFCIKRIGKLTEYMEYFPQTKKMIISMENIYTDFIKTFHACYMDVYIFKKVCRLAQKIRSIILMLFFNKLRILQ